MPVNLTRAKKYASHAYDNRNALYLVARYNEVKAARHGRRHKERHLVGRRGDRRSPAAIVLDGGPDGNAAATDANRSIAVRELPCCPVKSRD